MKRVIRILILFSVVSALSGCTLLDWDGSKKAAAERRAAAIKIQDVDVALAQYEADVSAKKYSRGDVSFPEKHEKRIAAMKEELALLRMKAKEDPEHAEEFAKEEKQLVGKISQYYGELLTYEQYADYLRLFRDSLAFSTENAGILGISSESLDKEIAEFHKALDERKSELSEKK